MPLDVSVSAQVKDGIAAVTVRVGGFAPRPAAAGRSPAGPRAVDTATVTLNGRAIATIHLGAALPNPAAVGFSVVGVKAGDVIAVSGKDDLGASFSAETRVAG